MILVKRLFFLVVLPALIFSLITMVQDDLALEVINSTRFSLSLGVCVVYWPGTIRLMLKREPLCANEIVLIGICYAFTASTLAGAWWFTWQWLGSPQSMRSNDFVQFNIFVYCIAAVLHLVAPRTEPNTVIPIRVWLGAVLVAVSSILITLGALHLHAMQ